MSVIAAICNYSGMSPVSGFQDRMLQALSDYGLDGSFSWSEGGVSLGGNLSRLLPEDSFDRQPLWDAGHSACLVADVRLDNRGDLARELGLVHPETRSDSEFLLAAWLRWGPSCLDRLVGAFAFAVWQPARQELFAARDHAGERPLFYCNGKDFFALASMPKGLLALPGAAQGCSESQVVDWVAGLPQDVSKSLFRGIERVPLGHFLRVTPDSFECKRYWHPHDARPIRFKKDADYAEALLEIFDRATLARLRSTGQVGSQLSAGMDSSAVTASAATLLAKQGRGLTAFTAVPRPDWNGLKMPWQIADEGPFAGEVAACYRNIEHLRIDSRGYELLPSMKSWTDALDEPTVNVVNILWITAIFDEAKRRGIGVMLQGGMGNLTFSWESWNVLSLLFRRGRWLKLAQTAHGLRRHGDISFRAAVASSLAGLIPRWLDRRLQRRLVLAVDRFTLANPAMVRKYDLGSSTLDDSPYDPWDLKAEQAYLFERVDNGPTHAAMQALFGIDLRDPTADKRVFEFCYAIPFEQYVVGGHSRSLARRAMKNRLPQSTLLRYRRGIQGMDWYLAMQESMAALKEEVRVIEQSPEARSTLDVARMQQLLEDWPSEGYERKDVQFVWELGLTRGISMGYFLRRHDPLVAVAQAVEPTPTPDAPGITTSSPETLASETLGASVK